MLLVPFRGLLWVCGELAAIAEDELEKEREEIKAKLHELYVRLDTGEIDESTFDAAEMELLDRLEALRADGRDEPASEEEEEGHA
jgi:hypothetical protein